MNKELFTVAVAATTVEGTDQYNEVFDAIVEDMAILNANTDLEDIHSIATASLALADATVKNDKNRVFLEECVQSAIGRYMAVSELHTWKLAKDSAEGPMKYACKTFYYPIIRVKEKRHPKVKTIIIRTIEPDQKQIDLIGLHEWVKGNDPTGGIGAKTSWLGLAKHLNHEMAKEAARSLGDKINANRWDNPANLKDPTRLAANFVSTDLITQFDETIKAMIGDEYTALDMESDNPMKDWNLIYRTYVTKDKKNMFGAKCAKDATLVGILQAICGRILHGESSYRVSSPIYTKQS